jgi:LPXTG-site transpeptidase (sortase) family protein
VAIKKSLYQHLGITFWILAAILALLPSWPQLYYRLSPKASTALASTIAATTLPQTIEPTPTPEPKPTPISTPTPTPKPLPDLDSSLPVQNGLIIEKIGVQGEIYEGEDWENILRKGIWRVPNFATPSDTDIKPVIIAAHRWGYLNWSQSFRKLNSFYNLPKVTVGDTIKINWKQRQYEYKVYAVQTGTEIPEYTANLILYTCQLWNSPTRYFVLANRVN